MRKKLLVGLGAIAALVAVLVVIVALQPGEFRISRSIAIAAPPAAVFAEVYDLHRWQNWSPWAGRDPAAQETYGGPETGPGSTYHWSGNQEVGEGTMTVIDSLPDRQIQIQLDFERPMRATNQAEFTFEPSGSETTVIWTMTDTNGLMAKAFQMFVDVDAMVGGDFEKGLARLKSLVEAGQSPGPVGAELAEDLPEAEAATESSPGDPPPDGSAAAPSGGASEPSAEASP